MTPTRQLELTISEILTQLTDTWSLSMRKSALYDATLRQIMEAVDVYDARTTKAA